MFQTDLRYLIVSLLVLSAACDTLGIESPSIHLSSELDVGRDLMKGCSSAALEASALCAGRQPYRLYAEPSSACTSYFWCAPGRGACLLTCAAGKVFDAACNCCRESTPSHAVDLATCSSSSSSGTNTQRRRLLGAEASTAQPGTTQTLQAPKPTAAAAAAAAAGSDLDDSTVIYYAATGVATDSKGQQVPLPQRSRPGPPAFGAWSAYGKHYSTGPFAGSNVVKEPAVGSPRQVPTGSSSSKISNEIGSRTFSAAVPAKPPVYAEDDSSPQRRSLLSQEQQHSTAQHAAARELSMKRLPPTSATAAAPHGDAAAAVAVAAVTTPAAAKPAAAAGSPPSAAKGLTPDDVDVPFLTVASVDAADRHRSHHHHPAARLMHADGSTTATTGGLATTTTTTPATATAGAAPASAAATTTASIPTTTTGSSSSSRAATSSGSSSSSRGGSDIIDMGRLTGPEEDAAQEDFDKAGGRVKVNPTIVPLPHYMRGKEGPYHYGGYPSKHAARRHRDHHPYTYAKYKGRKATKGYRGSHSEARHSYGGPHSSHSQYDESAESLQQ